MKMLEFLAPYPSWFKTALVVWVIGAALLIGGLILLNSNPKVSERAADPPQLVPTIKAISDSQKVANLSVREIVDAVRVVPPLQQASAANPYVGVQVEWIGYLNSAEQEVGKPNHARVNLYVNKTPIVDYSIWFSADLTAIPELRLLHQDSKIRVKGRIVSVSVAGISVDIDESEIEILERAKK